MRDIISVSKRRNKENSLKVSQFKLQYLVEFCGACCLVRNYVDSESMKVVRQFSMQE